MMNSNMFQKIERILSAQSNLTKVDFDNSHSVSKTSLKEIIQSETINDPIELRVRIEDELDGLGPLQNLISDPEVSEVLANSFDQIFFEKNGNLFRLNDRFFSEASYTSFIDRLAQQCNTYMNREKPFVECQLENLRITIVFGEISRGPHLISIRKQPKSRWTLEKLLETKWCNQKQLDSLYRLIQNKCNFLVVGGTGSGKTSFLQAVMQSLPELERLVIIEDTQELHPPNPVSTSLLTRQDPSRSAPDITMDDLLKRALRLRPDRLVVGEIRGAEAKSLLMALSTGHEGSFGSLHAKSATEALLRLEMLIQMGAPQWTLQSIRRLMAMTVQNIIVLEKKDGMRKLEGIYQISSLEENGLTLYRIDSE